MVLWAISLSDAFPIKFLRMLDAKLSRSPRELEDWELRHISAAMTSFTRMSEIFANVEERDLLRSLVEKLLSEA